MHRINEITKNIGGSLVSRDGCPINLRGKNRVNILALGDVGTTMLIGLRLLGSDVISSIGICDIRKENCERLEMEINQIGYPFGTQELPPVRIVGEEELFDCDVMIFCASRGVPPVKKGSGSGAQPDVRMAQLEANRELIGHYAELARRSDYRGLVCVVSDPVDNLCAAFLDASGLEAWQIQGYGLGVMNMRALYYSRKDSRFSSYETKGRAFGPHGADLVIANDVEKYDDVLSRELTELTVNANIRVRELGFKPYIAPALSSAAISILLTLRGEWHYGSLYFGSRDEGAFLGIKNRLTQGGFEYEDLPLDDRLFERIEKAYGNLCRIR
jgi:malate/lactate dehydrogenase